MLRAIFIAIFACFSILQATEIDRGTSLQGVGAQQGKAESTIELGDQGDATPLTATEKPERKPIENTDIAQPLLEADPIREREENTIAASALAKESGFSKAGEHNEYSEALENLIIEFDDEQRNYETSYSQIPAERLQLIGMTFLIEAVVTFLALIIIFQISGYINVLRQLILLSLTFALLGALFDLFLHLDFTNSIRAVGGFVVLLLLIKKFTAVRTWTTSIKLAIIARFVSMALMWLLMIGIFSLFSL